FDARGALRGGSGRPSRFAPVASPVPPRHLAGHFRASAPVPSSASLWGRQAHKVVPQLPVAATGWRGVPMAAVQSSPESPASRAPSGGRAEPDGKSVLIVEPRPSARGLMQFGLVRAGFQVRSVRPAEDAE